MIRIEIETENDAFQGGDFNRSRQVKKILDRVVYGIKDGERSGKIMDENGNAVAKWEDS